MRGLLVCEVDAAERQAEAVQAPGYCRPFVGKGKGAFHCWDKICSVSRKRVKCACASHSLGEMCSTFDKRVRCVPVLGTSILGSKRQKPGPRGSADHGPTHRRLALSPALRYRHQTGRSRRALAHGSTLSINWPSLRASRCPMPLCWM